MESRMRRLIIASATILTLSLWPALASADCNGPGCEPPPVVDGSVIVMTLAIVFVTFATLALAELRRR